MAKASFRTLADWCRSLATPLKAGVSVLDAVRMSAQRGSGDVRAINQHLLGRLEQGDDLAEAIEKSPVEMPRLVGAVAQIGVKTGRFPEMIRKLESYFRFRLQLKRQFLQQIFWPALQLVAAIFVIALMIYVIGILGQTDAQGKPMYDPLGLGLVGAKGAFVWLFLWGSAAAAAVIGWKLLKKFPELWRKLDVFLLRLPVAGPAFEALAMARLCLAMNVTMDSSLSIKKSLPLSLEATDTAAFGQLGKPIVQRIAKEGWTMHEAFAEHRVFPVEFLNVLQSGEESGSVPEEMGRLAEHYNEQAQFRMALLNQALGWCVWGMVAVLIVFLIFRMALKYVGMLNEAAKGI